MINACYSSLVLVTSVVWSESFVVVADVNELVEDSRDMTAVL